MLQCYTIDKITYQKIPHNFTPEKLSGHFGLLIPKQIDTIGYIDIKGPKWLNVVMLQIYLLYMTCLYYI